MESEPPKTDTQFSLWCEEKPVLKHISIEHIDFILKDLGVLGIQHGRS